MKEIKRSALMLSVAAMLVACGGGGGSEVAESEGGGGNTADVVDSGTNEQDTYQAEAVYGKYKKTAFDEINTARAAVGLSPVKQNTKLDKAAQGHTDYLVANKKYDHAQIPGSSGFTGASVNDRVSAAGYSYSTVGEILSIEYATRLRNIPDLIQGHLATVYHRTPILSAEVSDVGIGATYASLETLEQYRTYRFVVDFARPAGQAAARIPGDGSIMWPASGANDVPREMRGEDPSPVDKEKFPQPGYPVSFSVSRSLGLTVESFGLECSGVAIPTVLLTEKTDPNLIKFGDANWAFIVPKNWLPASAVCTAHFQGKSSDGKEYNKTWSFTTSSNTN